MIAQVDSSVPLRDLIHRAQEYLRKMPGAVQGEGGDEETFTVACVLIRDFGLSYDSAMVLFKEWNGKCKPPWSERELREKLQNAGKYGKEPIGRLVNARPLAAKAPVNHVIPQQLDAMFLQDWQGHRIKTWYAYENAEGQIIYHVARIEYQDESGERKKEFPIWCNGGWGFKGKGVQKVPFRLPKILHAPEGSEIWICEGEKDVLSLESLGLIATTNPLGAGKWLPEFNKCFKESFRVVIPPDNDDTGREHSQKVARSLHGRVASVKILPLPNLPEHGDVSDFIKDKDPVAAGEELSRLANEASEYIPTPENSENNLQSGSSAQSVIIHWASEALKSQPPIDWIVDPLFSAGTVNLIVGDPGCKKTWSLLDMAVCVASGKPWLGFTTKAFSVLIVDEESGLHRLNRRLGDVMRGHHVQEIPLAYISLEGINLRNSEQVERMRNAMIRTKARFVVIDALADAMLGGDENAVKDVQLVFAALRKLAEEMQAVILVIHHLNKGGQYRGSTAMQGAVDLMLKVESAQNSSQIDFKVEKSRDASVAPFSATAHFEPDCFHLACADPVNRPERLCASDEYVLRYLTEHGKSEVRKIMDNADTCSDGAAHAAIYRLAGKGKIKRVDGGGSGVNAVYDLVQQTE